MSRLPIPGKDSDIWGNILNDFLMVEHNATGSLKIRTDGTLNGIYKKPATGIPSKDLSSTVRSSLTSASSAVQSVNGKSGNHVTLTASDVNAPTTLAGDADVAVSGPTDGQVLTYDGTTGRWGNRPAPSAPVSSVNTQTGAVVLTAGSVGAVSAVGGGKETTASPTATTANTTIDLANGNVQMLTLSASTSVALTGATNGSACSLSLYIKQDGTGGWVITWLGNIKWPAGAAPTLSTAANKIDLVVLETLDGGATWYGSLAGADYR